MTSPKAASASAVVKPPENTDSASSSDRSSSESRPTDHSSTARSPRWRAGRSGPPPPSASRLSSNLRDSAPASSTRNRAAASSRASGMPSSCRHTRATSNRFSSVSAQPVPAAAARSERSATEATVAQGRELGLGAGGHRQRIEGQHVLAADAQRQLAGDQHPDLGTGPRHMADQRRHIDHLLEVVEHQEHSAGAQVIKDALFGVDLRDLGQPHRA